MSETTTDDMRALLIQQYPLGEATRAGADFDAWHRKELAKAWEEGCLAGRNRVHHRNMTPKQAEVAFPNPYKKEA